MIEAAKRKNIYERLTVGDLTECLAAETVPFDLILAADVFVYLPDLNPIFKAASEKLTASGLIAFTVETHNGEGAILRDTLRFAHGEPHRLRGTGRDARRTRGRVGAGRNGKTSRRG